MFWHKKIFKHKIMLNFIAKITYFYLKFVYCTTKWQKIGFEHPKQYWQEGTSFICAFWHNRLAMAPLGWNKEIDIYMLISDHFDGQIVSKIVSHWGIKTIFGSKNRGAIVAFKALLNKLATGKCIGITPDGPRGPRLEMSDGTIKLAQLSQCVIIPLTYAVKRKIVVDSWDKFIIPLPFNKGVIAWGKPIQIRSYNKDQLPQIKNKMQQDFNNLTLEAERHLYIE